MQDEIAMSSSDNVADCREALTNMCLIAGGCRQHQAFWKMQFERSGGRSLQHKHDPALQSKNATSGDVYALCLEDLQQNKLNISAEHLQIVWSPEDDVPEPIKNALRDAMRPLQTNGNGACSVHAGFGRPSVHRELFASNALQLAASLMSRLPALASEVPRAAFVWKASMFLSGGNTSDHICSELLQRKARRSWMLWNLHKRDVF